MLNLKQTEIKTFYDKIYNIFFIAFQHILGHIGYSLSCF